jgi:hypothetical protein
MAKPNDIAISLTKLVRFHWANVSKVTLLNQQGGATKKMQDFENGP